MIEILWSDSESSKKLVKEREENERENNEQNSSLFVLDAN